MEESMTTAEIVERIEQKWRDPVAFCNWAIESMTPPDETAPFLLPWQEDVVREAHRRIRELMLYGTTVYKA